jgi:hypothetical protein
MKAPAFLMMPSLTREGIAEMLLYPLITKGDV